MTSSPFHFTSFELEKCFRLKTPDGVSYCLPIHPDQDQELLAPYEFDRAFVRFVPYMLVEIETVCGTRYAVLEERVGTHYQSAMNGAPDHKLVTDTFDGIVWRVLGYENHMEEPIHMGEYLDAELAASVYAGLKHLLEPTKIVMTMHGGSFQFESASRASEVLVLDSYPEDVLRTLEDGGQVLKGAEDDPEQMALVVCRSSEVEPARTNHFWNQLQN